MPRRPTAVREPVQVYLEPEDRALLDRIAKKTGTSRAEILRQGIRRVGAEVLASDSPMLKLLTSAKVTGGSRAPADVALEHDRYLADLEQESWKRK